MQPPERSRWRAGVFWSCALAWLCVSGCADLSSEGALNFDAAPSSVSGGVSLDAEPGVVVGVEWRDLAHWSYWRGLVDPAMEGELSVEAGRWGMSTGRRVAVAVDDPDGEPVVDASVVLKDAHGEVVWRARTDNRGHAELFVEMFAQGVEGPLTVEAVTEGAAVSTRAEEAHEVERLRLTMPHTSAPQAVVDLMFVVDTTGTMDDELAALQVGLGDALKATRLELGDALGVRLSVNFYRDQGEAYVVKSNAFTTNLDDALAKLNREMAAGGGDHPEALDEALEDAIFEHSWSPSARARLLFVMLDAPPRQDPARVAALHAATARAAELGVRIIPIGASGIDLQTELLVRQLDVATGGTYVFLGDESADAQPATSSLPRIGGPVEVEPFGALLTRLITSAAR